MSQNKQFVVVTGGGTGGHLSIASSFIDELYKKDVNVIFVGTKNGLDQKWFDENDKLYKSYFLNTKAVVNKSFFGKILSLFMIAMATIYISLVLLRYKVKKVISVGGFSAAPCAFATILCRKNLYIHEQNAKMGRLNKLIAKNAIKVFDSYGASDDISDYPVPDKFFQNAKIRSKIKTILFIGGSQGATAINDFALKIAKELVQNGVKIIHQTGRNDYKRVKKEYEKQNIDVDCFDFDNNILLKMNKVDFAVSRAGASTLWELASLGIPALLVPYKYAADNHQYYNAKFLSDDELCFLCEEKDLKSEAVLSLINDDFTKMSEKLTKKIDKNGSYKIISYLLNDN